MKAFRSLSATLLQLMGFVAFFWLCNQLVAMWQMPIPGSVLGLGALVALMLAGAVPERAVKLGSAVLLGELLLFFIPPVISVLKYQVLLAHDGVSIVASVVLGTVMALTATAWVVDRVYTLEKRMNEKRVARYGQDVYEQHDHGHERYGHERHGQQEGGAS